MNSPWIVFERSAEAKLLEHSRPTYPHEGCGLLLGSAHLGLTVVREVTFARNLNDERAHDRYTLDPRDMLRAEKRASDIDGEIVGVWHTHPDHPAKPSVTDREAAWPGWSYVIVSVEEGSVADLRSWRLDEDAFQEERIYQ